MLRSLFLSPYGLEYGAKVGGKLGLDAFAAAVGVGEVQGPGVQHQPWDRLPRQYQRPAITGIAGDGSAD